MSSPKTIIAACTRTGKKEKIHTPIIIPNEFFVQTRYLISDAGLIRDSSFSVINSHDIRQEAYREIVEDDLTRTRDAIYVKNINLVKHLYQNNKFFDRESCDLAIQAGSLPILKYLVSVGFSMNNMSPLTAIDMGDMEIIKYLYDNFKALFNEEDVYEAARKGKADIVDYFIQCGTEMDESAIMGACEGGHLDILKKLYDSGAPIDETAVHICIENLQMECLEYLWNNNTPRYDDILYDAVKVGSLAMVKWLYHNGAYCDKNALKYAKEYNHPSIVSWLMNKNI